MLNFLRKMRRSLVGSGNSLEPSLAKGQQGRIAGSYILYAIGEITLVVIGILIALQINNWNEARKYAENEAYTLSEILNNLQEDADQIHIIVDRRNEAEAAIENLLHSLRQPTGLDQIDLKDVSSFLTFERYYPLNNAFEMLKSTGLKLSNKLIRTSISRYYDFEQKKVSQSIVDIEAVFLRIMQSKNPIRGNILRGKTGSNVRTELTLINPEDRVFREELLSELIPFQDNNRATLQKVMEFSTLNRLLIDQVKAEINTPRLRRYLSGKL